ncbi:hypothetical protein PV646_19145 [Streptomyces sp. ID05-26A]|nr:hypothetical protein [Streptomyces sp. ID05-26A]
MAEGSVARRVVAPTIVMAVFSSGSAIVVNLATEWKNNPLAWVGVVVLTAATAGVAYWLWRAQGAAQEPGPQSTVERSVTGEVHDSTVIIGDGNQVQR